MNHSTYKINLWNQPETRLNMTESSCVSEEKCSCGIRAKARLEVEVHMKNIEGPSQQPSQLEGNLEST